MLQIIKKDVFILSLFPVDNSGNNTNNSNNNNNNKNTDETTSESQTAVRNKTVKVSDLRCWKKKSDNNNQTKRKKHLYRLLFL